MSVVIALSTPNGLVIAGDGRVTTDNGDVSSDEVQKVYSYAHVGMAFGIVGTLVGTQTIASKLDKDPSMQVIVDAVGEIGNCSVLAVGWDKSKPRISELAVDSSEFRRRHFGAIGSGADIAIGAVEAMMASPRWAKDDPSKMARDIIKWVAKHNYRCGGKIQVVKL